jgi:hypothetical protein
MRKREKLSELGRPYAGCNGHVFQDRNIIQLGRRSWRTLQSWPKSTRTP